MEFASSILTVERKCLGESKMNYEEIDRFTKRNKCTKKELSITLGISESWIYAWINGTREVPKWLKFALVGIETSYSIERKDKLIGETERNCDLIREALIEAKGRGDITDLRRAVPKLSRIRAKILSEAFSTLVKNNEILIYPDPNSTGIKKRIIYELLKKG